MSDNDADTFTPSNLSGSVDTGLENEVSPRAIVKEGSRHGVDMTADTSVSFGQSTEVLEEERLQTCGIESEDPLQDREATVVKEPQAETETEIEAEIEAELGASIANEEENGEEEEKEKEEKVVVDDEDDEDDEDEFGDFDEFNESENPPHSESFTTETALFDEIALPDTAFENIGEFETRLEKLMSKLFCIPTPPPVRATNVTTEDSTIDKTKEEEHMEILPPEIVDPATVLLFDDRVRTIYEQISTIPHLQPPNWVKLNIRHNMVINLGIPINLDELKSSAPAPTPTPAPTLAQSQEQAEKIRDTQAPSQTQDTLPSTSLSDSSLTNSTASQTGTRTLESGHLLNVPSRGQSHHRRKSITADDIDWRDFDVPQFESLKLNAEESKKVIDETSKKLSQFEIDNMENTSLQFLESRDLEFIEKKLSQLRSNRQELLQASSIWQNQLNELQKDYEIYENVVQSCIGYSQKLRREEIMENLKKMKLKKKGGKAKFTTWKK